MDNIGAQAERMAADYLKKQGLKIVAQNFRSRFGEIDLIAKDANTLVFVEVRFRKRTAFGTGAESVTSAKQKKLIKTAQTYLQKMRADTPCRFDVISMTDAQELFKIDWIRGAF